MHQQMFQQYQAMLAQQMAMQQQMMNANGSTTAGGNGATNSAAAFGAMPTFPMMNQMPGVMPGATADASAQQQFMAMPGFMPTMPFGYPNNQMQGFQKPNEEK